jgi:hypothetical protein
MATAERPGCARHSRKRVGVTMSDLTMTIGSTAYRSSSVPAPEVSVSLARGATGAPVVDRVGPQR